MREALFHCININAAVALKINGSILQNSNIILERFIAEVPGTIYVFHLLYGKKKDLSSIVVKIYIALEKKMSLTLFFDGAYIAMGIYSQMFSQKCWCDL